MLNHIKSAVTGALLGALLGTAAIGPAWSQIIMNQTPMPVREPSPRQGPIQAIHYIRTTFNWNSCSTQTSNICTFKIANAALPYNSVIIGVYTVVYTAFNSTSSDTLSLGTNTTGTNIMAAVSIAATGMTSRTVAATQATTGGATTPTGLQGGFDVWGVWTSGTGNTATTGNMSFVITYIAPNDGACSPTSIDNPVVATTNPGC